MGMPGPQMVKRYGVEFKLAAVAMNESPGKWRQMGSGLEVEVAVENQSLAPDFRLLLSGFKLRWASQ